MTCLVIISLCRMLSSSYCSLLCTVYQIDAILKLILLNAHTKVTLFQTYSFYWMSSFEICKAFGIVSSAKRDIAMFFQDFNICF